MRDSDIASYRQRYTARLQKFGHDPRTLGWEKGRQNIRFAALTGVVDLASIDSILDVGCGFGDLYPYLREQGYSGRYAGIDFVPELIQVGRTAYPDADLRVATLSDLRSEDSFDFVMASGVFNAKLGQSSAWHHVTESLERMFQLCRIATAADFLSCYVDYQLDHASYSSPEDVFRFSKSLTRRVALRHDYLPFEFLVGLHRSDSVSEHATFDGES